MKAFSIVRSNNSSASTRHFAICPVFVAFCGLTSADTATAAIRPAVNTVAHTGLQVPGQPAGATFSSLNVAAPSISPTGQVVFAGAITGGSTTYGLFAGNSFAGGV
jgi:hypothetical protein